MFALFCMRLFNCLGVPIPAILYLTKGNTYPLLTKVMFSDVISTVTVSNGHILYITECIFLTSSIHVLGFLYTFLMYHTKYHLVTAVLLKEQYHCILAQYLAQFRQCNILPKF